MSPPLPIIIWRVVDGKPGHEKQTLGLGHALQQINSCVVKDLHAENNLIALAHWLFGKFPMGKKLPPPDLILGAGHRTHFSLLAARRAFGGKIVVCMKPSLPLPLFDLCLIPQHDHPPKRRNVIETRGALNSVAPGGKHDLLRGLILIGGPSTHFIWDSHSISTQVTELIRNNPKIRWTLTTSRRTPSDFLDHLQNTSFDLRPAEETPPGWLEAQLSEHGHAWVTPDSVSMIYEALTAGCVTGLFQLQGKTASRVARGVSDLIEAGLVTHNTSDLSHTTSTQTFDESQRCAKLIMQRCFNVTPAAA